MGGSNFVFLMLAFSASVDHVVALNHGESVQHHPSVSVSASVSIGRRTGL